MTTNNEHVLFIYSVLKCFVYIMPFRQRCTRNRVKKESEDQLLANNYYFANGGTTLCTYIGCQGFNFINYLLIKCKFIKNGKMMRGDFASRSWVSCKMCLLIKFKCFNLFSCVLLLRHRRARRNAL